MGREIKRVALDFNHPVGLCWDGYINPHKPDPCPDCPRDYKGYSRVAARLYPDFRKELLSQDEIDALIDGHRLMDLTHTYSIEHGWQPRTDGYRPNAEEILRYANVRVLGLDATASYAVLEARCKRLGLPLLCATCEGDGFVWPSPELEKLHDDWKPIDPPAGSGWQVWETVSEGSPVTPVFETPEALAKYLSDFGDLWTQKSLAEGKSHRQRPSYESALKFVMAGWAPSMMMNVRPEGTESFGPYGEKV